MSDVSVRHRITRNTLFLYFRMLLMMAVSFITVRVVLRTLGVEDYGIYQVVGGVVNFLTFVSNALATGSLRFITFELGKGGQGRIGTVFSTLMAAHAALAILVVLVAETGGVWFINTQLVISPERMAAATFAYHCSVITIFFSITQVPYNALIIAHEKMDAFARISILEALLKLGSVYLLLIMSADKLEAYSLMVSLVSIGIMMINRLYCRRHFPESSLQMVFDRAFFRNVAAFSCWSLVAAITIVLSNQGITVVCNMFFPAAVVSARSITLQVSNAVNMFINNIRMAFNPQIVKKYAAKDYTGSQKLLLLSTKFTYYLMLAIALPLTLTAEPVLRLWLGEVPDYTVIFLQIIMLQSLVSIFDASFYTALYTMGRLRENAILNAALGFLPLPVVYVLFSFGFSPVAMSVVMLINYSILGLVFKPYLLHKVAGYHWCDICEVYRVCIKVTVFAVPVPLGAYYLIGTSSWLAVCGQIILSITLVGLAVWRAGLTEEIRKLLVDKIKKF